MHSPTGVLTSFPPKCTSATAPLLPTVIFSSATPCCPSLFAQSLLRVFTPFITREMSDADSAAAGAGASFLGAGSARGFCTSFKSASMSLLSCFLPLLSPGESAIRLSSESFDLADFLAGSPLGAATVEASSDFRLGLAAGLEAGLLPLSSANGSSKVDLWPAGLAIATAFADPFATLPDAPGDASAVRSGRAECDGVCADLAGSGAGASASLTTGLGVGAGAAPDGRAAAAVSGFGATAATDEEAACDAADLTASDGATLVEPRFTPSSA